MLLYNVSFQLFQIDCQDLSAKALIDTTDTMSGDPDWNITHSKVFNISATATQPNLLNMTRVHSNSSDLNLVVYFDTPSDGRYCFYAPVSSKILPKVIIEMFNGWTLVKDARLRCIHVYKSTNESI